MVKYDTPTDGISRKQFDRYGDRQEIKYGRYAQRVLDLETRVLKLEKLVEEIIALRIR